jgi:hypothetical protein
LKNKIFGCVKQHFLFAGSASFINPPTLFVQNLSFCSLNALGTLFIDYHNRQRKSGVYLLCVMLLNNVRRICIKLQWKYGGEQVYVAGQFNDWQPNTLPMNKNNDDVWELKLRLPAGRYQYKVLSLSLSRFSYTLLSPLIDKTFNNINS